MGRYNYEIGHLCFISRKTITSNQQVPIVRVSAAVTILGSVLEVATMVME